MTYFEAIRNARINSGLTAKELGEKIGILENSMLRYERGVTKPNIEIIIKIADILDVSLDYLVGRSDDPTRR